MDNLRWNPGLFIFRCVVKRQKYSEVKGGRWMSSSVSGLFFWEYSSHFLSLQLALRYSTLTPPLFCVKQQLPSRDGCFLRLACLLVIRLTLVLFSRSECTSFWDPPHSRYSLRQRKQRHNECSCCMSHVLSLHSDNLGWSHIAGNREVQKSPCSLFCC